MDLLVTARRGRGGVVVCTRHTNAGPQGSNGRFDTGQRGQEEEIEHQQKYKNSSCGLGSDPHKDILFNSLLA